MFAPSSAPPPPPPDVLRADRDAIAFRLHQLGVPEDVRNAVVPSIEMLTTSMEGRLTLIKITFRGSKEPVCMTFDPYANPASEELSNRLLLLAP
jgi:hypothetical protein